MPKISVIMPSLNVADFIRESVCSVLRQSLRDIEIICVDAGSIDGTWEILNELAGTDSRLRVYCSDKKSYGYQVNLGIQLAKGEYIAVVETDDYIDTGMYEILYQAAQEYHCDYVKSDYFFYWTQADGERFFIKKKMFQEDSLYGKIIEPLKNPQISGSDWYLWNGIYRRSFLLQNQIRFSETPGAAFQDIGFLYRTGICAKRVLYLRKPFYRYCIDRDGSSSNSGKALEYAYQEFRELVKQRCGNRTMDREALQALYIRMTRSFLYSYPELDWENKEGSQDRHRLSYAWFQEQIGQAIKDRLLTRDMFRDEVWDRLCMLLVSEQQYYDGIQERNDYFIRQLGEDRRHLVVIFGCGHCGFLAYKWLEKRQYTVAAFMDNNKELWGRTINGIPIRSPEDVAARKDDVKYCIANALYYRDIKEQIMKNGVKEEQVVVLV